MGMMWFNAGQVTLFFAILPFLISWLSEATFKLANAAFWVSIAVYVIMSIWMWVMVAQWMEKPNGTHRH